MFKRKGGKRPQRKGRGRKGKGIKPNRSKLGLNPAVHNRNYAQITETYKNLVGGGPSTSLAANTSYFASTSIVQYPRAIAIARCFKFYRLKSIIYEYVPDANTYQAGTVTVAETVPYMYYMMNRDASDTTGVTLAQFQNAGARPIKFTKKLVITYKPNLVKTNNLVVKLTGGQSLYNAMNEPVYNQWISTAGLQHPNSPSWAGETIDFPVQVQGDVTNPIVGPDMINALPYYGHNFFFQQQNTPEGTSSVGYMSITCIWEFKEPVLYAVGSNVTET